MWHGRKLLLGRSVGKTRVVGVRKRIFILDLYQNFRIWGCDMVDIKDWRGDKDEN